MLRRAEVPYTVIYSLYGSLLVEMKRLEEARAALEKGLRWNPMHFGMMSEYMETYKMQGDMDEFFRLTVQAFKIAIHRPQLARCYRNLGYYFIEKELYPEAKACYFMSLHYEPDSKQASSELYAIHMATDGKLPDPTAKDLGRYSVQYGFPLGPDENTYSVGCNYGKYFMEQGNKEAALYCFKIS